MSTQNKVSLVLGLLFIAFTLASGICFDAGLMATGFACVSIAFISFMSIGMFADFM